MQAAGFTPLTSIGVVALALDGRGDITGADKIATLLSELLPKANVIFSIFDRVVEKKEFIVWDGSKYNLEGESSVEVPGKLSNAEQVRSLKRVVTPQAEFIDKIASMDCIILYPTYADISVPKELMSRYQEKNIPLIKFRESGAVPCVPSLTAGKTFPLGIEPAEYGIILPEDLYQYYLTHCNESSLDRLRNLKDLSSTIQQDILENPYSEEVVKVFNQKAKLFVGYCRHPKVALDFVTTVVQLSDKNETTDVVVYIMNHQMKFLEYYAKNTDLDLKKIFKKAVRLNGFGRVIITEGDQTVSFELKAKAGSNLGNRRVRLLLRNCSAADSSTLFKASEQESQATGEQSVWELLALGKPMAIEVTHQRVGAAKSYVKMLKQHNEELGKLFERSLAGLIPVERLDDFFQTGALTDLNMVDHKVNFFKALRENPKMRQDWAEFIENLNVKHQLRHRLPEILQSVRP